MNKPQFKHLSILLFPIFLFAGCKSSKGIEYNSEYFEGEIEYSISYEIKTPRFTQEYLETNYGSKVIKKFKKGNFIDIVYNNENTIISTCILNLKRKQFYGQFNKTDTIYFSDINRSTYHTDLKVLKDTVIHNHECWSIRTSSIEKDNHQNMDSLISIHYISKHLKFNPIWYSDYIDGANDRVSQIAPGIGFRSVSSNNSFNSIREIKRTSLKNIDDSIFYFDNKLPTRKMN